MKPPDTTPTLDTNLALIYFGGDIALLSEFANLFLAQCDANQRDIEAAVAQRDSDKLERAAHSLRGVASQFAAQATAEAARQLEMAAHDRDFRSIAPAWKALHGELQRLRPALAQLKVLPAAA